MPKTLNTLWEPPFPFPKGAENLSPKGVIAATPALVSILKKSSPQPLDKLCSVFMLGGAQIFTGSEYFLAGPVLGAPMAVMILEILAGGGAEKIIFAGFAGSLSPELRLGDVFLPDAAVSTEGTSAHYPADLLPDPDLYALLRKNASDHGIFHPGMVWSTDGPLRETKLLRQAFTKAGAIAVEMEVSALFAAARFRGLKLGAVLLITDIFENDNWRAGFDTPHYNEGLLHTAGLSWDTITHFE